VDAVIPRARRIWRFALGLVVSCMAACQTVPEDPARSPHAIREALVRGMRVEAMWFDADFAPSARRHFAWAAQEKQTRLWKQLSVLTTSLPVEDLTRIEARDLHAKLDVLARDRQRRPALYERLYSRYLARRPIASATQAVRALDPNDVSEETRWVWESVLLLPYGSNVAPGAGELALEALARIGNPASTPVLLQFADAVRHLPAPQSELMRAHQRLVAQTLMRMPGETSAAGLLELRRWARDVPPDSVSARDWLDRVVFESARHLSPAHRRAWLEVSAQYRGETLFDELPRQLERGVRDDE
jgi:hypothetical protein